MPPAKRQETESVTVSDVYAVCTQIQAAQTELSSKISHVDQKLESIETIVYGVLVECNGADGEAAEKLNQILTALQALRWRRSSPRRPRLLRSGSRAACSQAVTSGEPRPRPPAGSPGSVHSHSRRRLNTLPWPQQLASGRPRIPHNSTPRRTKKSELVDDPFAMGFA